MLRSERPSRKHDEQKDQVALVEWFRYQYPDLAPLLTLGSFGENIGSRRMSMLKKMGLTPGYPDLALFVPVVKQGFDKHVSGLFVELKSQHGRVSKAQHEIHSQLRRRGYQVNVCWCWDEAKQIIDDYLSNAHVLRK